MAVERLAYRIPEFALAIGCSRAKTYELVACGDIPSIKIGHSLRIPAAEGRAWIARKVVEQPGHVAEESGVGHAVQGNAPGRGSGSRA